MGRDTTNSQGKARLDIFGDSFSCPKAKYTEDKTWLEIIEPLFKINNHSLYGTGAQYCIEKFMAHTEHGEHLLFMLPDMNRLWLQYLPPEKASESSLAYQTDKLQTGLVRDIHSKICNDYESYYNTGLQRILEVLFTSFIFTKSKQYHKILIWPSSGTGYPFANYNHTLEMPDNVYIVPRCLNMFAEEKQNNHLSPYNHAILASQIHYYFIENKTPDISEFRMQ